MIGWSDKSDDGFLMLKFGPGAVIKQEKETQLEKTKM